jgi:hypothetical protein
MRQGLLERRGSGLPKCDLLDYEDGEHPSVDETPAGAEKHELHTASYGADFITPCWSGQPIEALKLINLKR